MADQPLGHATAGNPLEIKASDWNALTDAAREVHAQRLGREGGSAGRNPLVPALRVMVKLTSGPWAATNIVSFDRASTIIDPDVNPFEAARNPVLARKTGSLDQDDPWGILCEPVSSDGGIVPIVIKGVCVAEVNIHDVAHHFCERGSSGSVLQSTVYGRARILFKPAGTGQQTCLIDILNEDGKGAFGNYYTFSPSYQSLSGYGGADRTTYLLTESITRVPANKDLWASVALRVDIVPFITTVTGNCVNDAYLIAYVCTVDPLTSAFAVIDSSAQRIFGNARIEYSPGVKYTPNLPFEDQAHFGFKLPAASDDYYIGLAIEAVNGLSGSGSGPGVLLNSGSGSYGIGEYSTWIALMPAAPDVPNTVPPPWNTVIPSITGTAQDGQTLTASTGTWVNTPTSYAYQWSRSGTPIGGATGSTYVLVLADVGETITVTVTATNAGGSGAATSAPTAVVIP